MRRTAWLGSGDRPLAAALAAAIASNLARCPAILGKALKHASAPRVTYVWMAAAAPPESARQTIGTLAAAAPIACARVPGPPCTMSSTIGTPRALQHISRRARVAISEPHAAPPCLPESTSTKCEWCGLSGAPFADGGPPA
jgi:hypothetical protein